MMKRLSTLALGLLVGCVDQGPPTLELSVTEVESPAGDDSGEPFLSSSKDGVYLSWLEAAPEGGHELRLSEAVSDGWSEPTVVAASDAFFVNWADFPSVSPGPGGTLWAHWLQRGGSGTYDYGVRIARSSDGGHTWSEPWTPHDDGTPTEHGFVSVVAFGESVGVAWLDGRQFVDGPDGKPATREMTLRFRELAADGVPGPETLLDARACDCCQTDAALSTSGPVVVYRDRSDAEIRDIYITRLVDGAWTEGAPVHADGWEIGGCPVNGPAVAAAGERLAVAWFTGAGDVPRVKVAFSEDGGASFGDPAVVDGGNPAGRVDLLGLADGDVLVTWLERTGDEGAEIRMRRVRPDGSFSDARALTSSTSARASGFPRIVEAPNGSIFMAWTDATALPTRVRVSRLEVDR